jgi:putative ABC transport system permease protein
MLRIYLRTTLANLWKNKTFSLLNILGLAIGICCAGLIFLWVEDEMTFDRMHAKKDRLYQVNINATFGGTLYTMGSTPRPMGAAMLKEIPGVINAARISDEHERALFRINDKSIYLTGSLADSSLFSMFSFTFKQGNAASAFNQLYSLVITESSAKKLFGNETDVIGKTVQVDNKNNYTVTGVIEDLPANSTLQFEWVAPYAIRLDPEDAVAWGSYGPFTYVELSDNANLAAINQQLKNFIAKKEEGQNKEAFLYPLSKWRLYNEFENGKATGSGRIREVRLLSAIAWIILIIACINFMNLATANSQQRAKEVGIHKTLGAGRSTLIARFMGEALLMSLLAAALSVLLIVMTLPAFNLFMQKQLIADITNPRHITALLSIAVICGIIAGSYPSAYLSSFKPVLVLKGLKLKTGGAAAIRKGLVVLQFTVSIVFICATIVVYQQVQHVKNRKLGLDRENLIEVNMQHEFTKSFPAIKQDLVNTGVIQNAAMADHSTLRGGNTDSRFRWQGKPEQSEIHIAYRHVSPEYIATSGMQIGEGRDFNADGASEPTSIIINRSLAKLMGNESAVGKIIQSPRDNEEDIFTNLTVVGVVEDYVYGNMFGYSGPVMFFCKPSSWSELLYVRTRPGSQAENALAKIESVIKKHNPEYPFQYKFVDDQFNELFKNELLVGQMSGVFSLLAIIISCLGLFGLATFTAVQRTKEIGVRKVLGASVSGLAGLLSKDFIKLVIIACLVAFPVAWWITHDWLQQYQYRITVSWWIFIAAGAIAVFIALATVSVQAVRAAMANPVNSLRAL